MDTVNCSNPQIIINPRIFEFAIRSDKFFVDGVPHTINSSQRYRILSGDRVSSVLSLPYVYNFDKGKYRDSDFKQMRNRLYNYLDNSFFMTSDGVFVGYIWMLVPCGKCDVCQSKKISSIVQRCQFAQEESGYSSVFVTLSYNAEHLPLDGKVNRRDCQLFFKKLKSALSRCHWIKDASSYAHNLKWVYSAEYGSLGRPHYHLLLHGIPSLSDNSVQDSDRLHWLIYYAWRDSHRLSNGRFESLDDYCKNYPLIFRRPKDYDPFSKGFVNVEIAKSTKSATYILKYVTKCLGPNSDNFTLDSEFPEDESSYSLTFIPNAKKHKSESLFYGISCNLGLSFVKRHFESICSSVDGSFTYHSKVYNELVKCNLTSYYIRKLFPSESQLISSDHRKHFLRMHYLKFELLNAPELSNAQKVFVCDCVEYIDNLYPFLVLHDLLDLRKRPKYIPKDCFVHLDVDEDDLIFDEVDFINGTNNGLTVSNLFLDSFVEDVNYLNNHRLDFLDIQKRLLNRVHFFAKLKSRTYDEICDVGRKFSKQNKVSLSKSFLQ